MEVNEISSEGLKRELRVVVGADAIEEKVGVRLIEVGGQVRLPGFRPGKVPMDILRKRFGQTVRDEVLEKTIEESTQTALAERELKPAVMPNVDIVSSEEGKDLEFSIKLEVLPEITPNDFAAIKLERQVVLVKDEDLNDALGRIAESNKVVEPLAENVGAESGHVVVIDFVGTVDGEAFEGGSSNNFSLELGTGSFIEGFEEQLIGSKAGDQRNVSVEFPEGYHNADLAGKSAVFDVKVSELRKLVLPNIDDDLAKRLGLDDVEALKTKTREQLENDYSNLSRMRLKRELLDQLSDNHDFEVPESMTDMEFQNIWRQLEQVKEADQLEEADKEKSEDQLREEYKAIATRRVRLGLLLSHVGQQNSLSVSPEDINRAIGAEASRYPGQEQAVVSHYQNNPQALESLKAPILEDKVVDFIIELAEVTDKEVNLEELLKDTGAVET